jgi:hypothetical protein
MPLTDTIFNGSFANEPASIYRNDPSPEVDGAWSRIADVGRLLITEEDVVGLGKDPKSASKAPEKLLRAMGREHEGDLYEVQIDVFHQLHCLNEIRKHVYWDYYATRNWGGHDNPSPHTPHVSWYETKDWSLLNSSA